MITDTGELTLMAYYCTLSASDPTDILKSELGAESSKYKIEERFLSSILI